MSSSNVVNSVAYLRTSRNFPREIGQLTVEVDRSYVDIANAVNQRVIGIFPTNVPAVTGESWFFTNQRQQSLRQIYSISGYSSFNHNINFNSVSTFTKISGIGFDGTNYFPLPFVNGTVVTNSVEMYVTPTEVVFVSSAGSPQAISGFVLLEWLSMV
jgi:hypothetical protein